MYNRLSSVKTNRSTFNISDRIIGIDAASAEKNCPPEYFGYVFRKHRFIDSTQKKLGITYHVGEDFLTVANGLRVIDEAIEFLCMHRGDRLGHAIALGIDIDDYLNVKNFRILTTVQDYLDDLCWVYKMVRDSMDQDGFVLQYLGCEINKYISRLYNEEKNVPPTEQYIFSLYLRGDVPEVYCDINEKISVKEYNDIIICHGEKINYRSENHKEAFLSQEARKCYRDYHFSNRVKTNGSQELDLKANENYVKAIKIAQHELRKKICKIGISVEVNPSSNLKISYAKSLKDIHLLKLNDKGLRKIDCCNNQFNIPVSLNTDDSAVFQTNLINEYSIVASQLINQGYDAESVYSYIDYLREMSYEVNFLNNK